MSRKSKAILVASHLLLFVAGGGLAWQSAVCGGFFQQKPAGLKVKSDRAVGVIRHSAGPWTGSEYARAWKALRGGIYTTKERVRVQRDLLEQWAEVDLAAAIEAALGEAWDRDGGSEFDPSGPLLDVFSEALARNPQEGWDMIRGRQFGVGTGMLRRVWMEAVGMADPLFLANRITGLSWRDQPLALSLCHAAVQSGAGGATQAEMFGIFAALPPQVVGAEQLIGFTTLPDGPFDLAAMKREIILAGDDDRMVKVKAHLLGMALAGTPPEEIAEETADLPPAARIGVVWAAFEQADTPASLLDLADLLVDEEAWEKLAQPETARRFQEIARNDAARDLADWAMTLPVRQEAQVIFQRAVEVFLAGNLEASSRWLGELPEGVWRDRAYAEFSQAALHVHQNSRASRWALNRIGDRDFKKEAENWRAQWEQRTGWTQK
ncbi:MAG: hypothetical protein ACRCXD_16220 [Luteolibacter sp.]